MTGGCNGKKNAQQHPKSYIVDAGRAESEMADPFAEQAHFAQDCREDR